MTFAGRAGAASGTGRAAAAAAAFACVAAVLSTCGAEGDASALPAAPTPIDATGPFPLAEPLTLTVGVTHHWQAPAPAVLAHLTERTGVTLDFIVVTGRDHRARSLELAERSAVGTFPDILAEDVAPFSATEQRRLLTNLLHQPELVPNLRQLLDQDGAYRNGTASRLLAPDELYALGVHDRTASPYVGALAYRQDLFEADGLEAGTWDQLADALIRLQTAAPRSVPFAATEADLFFRAPSWFRSGLDTALGAYYHPDEREWTFGPYQREFEDYVRWFARLVTEQLIGEEDILQGASSVDVARRVRAGSAFVVSWRGHTGPAMRSAEGYGTLDEAGEWDGTGSWIAALPLPRGRRGAGWLAPRPWTAFSSGWAVSAVSPRRSEAVRFLDYLLGDAVVQALAAAGPADADGLLMRIPGPGRERPTPTERYAAAERAIYLQQNAVVLEAWPPVLRRSRPFVEALGPPLAEYVVTETHKLMTGERPLAEFDAFREELRARGADRLLDWLRFGQVGEGGR